MKVFAGGLSSENNGSAASLTTSDSATEVVASIAGLNSFNRLIEPAEIAELIFWVHHNPVINGAVLHGNLGQKES